MRSLREIYDFLQRRDVSDCLPTIESDFVKRFQGAYDVNASKLGAIKTGVLSTSPIEKNSSSLGRALICIERAILFTQMQQKKECESQLEDALSILKEIKKPNYYEKHCFAVVLWLMGYQKQISGGLAEEIIGNWELSLKIFGKLSSEVYCIEPKWYEARIRYIRKELTEYINLNSSSTGMKTPNMSTVSVASVNNIVANNKRIKINPGKPRNIDVFAGLAAGFPAQVNNMVGAQENIQINEATDVVILEGLPYYIQGLRSIGNILNLNPSLDDYVIVKINGDSMNKAGIEDGDFVLLQRKPVADSNDIVAAWIITDPHGTENPKMTLKRYVLIESPDRMGRKSIEIELRPESNNNKYTVFRFLPRQIQDVRFDIRGIALAVFKPELNLGNKPDEEPT